MRLPSGPRWQTAGDNEVSTPDTGLSPPASYNASVNTNRPMPPILQEDRT